MNKKVNYICLKCKKCSYEDVKIRFLSKSSKPICPKCQGVKFDKIVRSNEV